MTPAEPAKQKQQKRDGDGKRLRIEKTSADETVAETKLPLSRARCISLVATVTGAAFLNTLAVQSTVIILPTIGRDLDVPDSRLQWIVSSYSLTFGCFLLLWGRVADIYGKRLIFIAGSIWVTVVTAANPFLPDEIAFDVFRGLHGLGAAANVPTAIGILGVTFPPGKAKNYAFSTYAAGAPLGSVFGNMLSGIVAQYASWKWVFGVLAIMAGFVSVAGILVIPQTPPPIPTPAPGEDEARPLTVDWIGGALITVALVLLLFALTEGNVVGWSTPYIPVLVVLSLLLVAVFVAWQWYLEQRTWRRPLIKVSLFRNVRFSAAMVIMALLFASFNDYLIYATYYFQDYQGHSPFQTMLRFLPTGISGALTALVVSQLLGRVPTCFLLATGNLAMPLACLLFALPIPPTTSYFAYCLPAMVLSVVAADTAWPSLTLFTSRSLPPEDQALGGALINATGQIGRAIGLAVTTAIQTAVMARARGRTIQDSGPIEKADPASLKGIRAANWVSFALGLTSFAVVMLFFRSTEIVGKAEPPAAPVQEISGAEEGIMNEEHGMTISNA